MELLEPELVEPELVEPEVLEPELLDFELELLEVFFDELDCVVVLLLVELFVTGAVVFAGSVVEDPLP